MFHHCKVKVMERKALIFIFFVMWALVISLFLFAFSMLKAPAHPHDMEIFNNDKHANPEMKNMCSVCHVSPGGGGPRNEFGMVFEANNETITNNIRKQFPELFHLVESTTPKITRVKPSVFIVGKETSVMILGKNFAEDIILHIDSVSLESTPHIEHAVVSSKRIDVKVTFDKVGVHTFHIVSALGQVSNVFKVKAKP